MCHDNGELILLFVRSVATHLPQKKVEDWETL